MPAADSTKPAPSAARGSTSSVPTSATSPSAAEAAVKKIVPQPAPRIARWPMPPSRAACASGRTRASGAVTSSTVSTEPMSAERKARLPAFSTTERKP
jgi:hypothetical protein